MADIIAIIGAFMCGWLSRDAPGTFLKRTVLIVSYALSSNYCGKSKGGIRNSWRWVDQNLSLNDAIRLMNKKM